MCTLVPNNFGLIDCLSVCSLPHFLFKIWLNLGIFALKFQMISDLLFVCQSVNCLTSLLKLVYQWYLQFWMSNLSQIFWRYSLDVCALILNNFRFLVCLSVWSLPQFLTENRLSVITPILDELSFSNFQEIIRGCLYIRSN